jgi:large subunit ribosomal protein L29
MAKKAKKKTPREMDNTEIEAQLKDMQEKSFRLRFQLAMGQTEGIKRVREMKKDRARLLTIQRERELQTAGTKA